MKVGTTRQYLESILLLNGAAIVLLQTHYATVAYVLLALSVILSITGIALSRKVLKKN